MITKKRLKNIKANVYMRSEIAKISRIGIDTSLKEELELLKEIERLNNIINELEQDVNNQLMMTRILDKYNEGYFDATLHYHNKLKELKESDKE